MKFLLITLHLSSYGLIQYRIIKNRTRAVQTAGSGLWSPRLDFLFIIPHTEASIYNKEMCNFILWDIIPLFFRKRRGKQNSFSKPFYMLHEKQNSCNWTTQSNSWHSCFVFKWSRSRTPIKWAAIPPRTCGAVVHPGNLILDPNSSFTAFYHLTLS